MDLAARSSAIAARPKSRTSSSSRRAAPPRRETVRGPRCAVGVVVVAMRSPRSSTKQLNHVLQFGSRVGSSPESRESIRRSAAVRSRSRIGPLLGAAQVLEAAVGIEPESARAPPRRQRTARRCPRLCVSPAGVGQAPRSSSACALFKSPGEQAGRENSIDRPAPLLHRHHLEPAERDVDHVRRRPLVTSVEELNSMRLADSATFASIALTSIKLKSAYPAVPNHANGDGFTAGPGIRLP